MPILLNPGCHTDTTQWLPPALSPTHASHFTNSLMTCPDFSMDSSHCCIHWLLTQILHDLPFLNFQLLVTSIPVSHGVACPAIGGKSCLCLSAAAFLVLVSHPAKVCSPCSFNAILLAAERAIASLLPGCIQNMHKPLGEKPQTVGRTAALLHLPLLQTHLCL